MSKVDEIAHDYLDRISVLDPIEATSRGTLGHDSEMTDYSPAGGGGASRPGTKRPLAAGRDLPGR